MVNVIENGGKMVNVIEIMINLLLFGMMEIKDGGFQINDIENMDLLLRKIMEINFGFL